MKIAFICTEKLPVPPIAGGAVQLYIEGILPYLSASHDITVYSIAYPGLSLEESLNGVRHIRISASTAAKYVSRVKAALDTGYDLVHIFNRPLWVAPIAEVLPNTCISLSLHNEMFHPEKISDMQAAKCVDRVEFINTVSRFIADGVEKRIPAAKEKLHVVYSGADTGKYATNWSEKGKLNQSELKKKYGLSGMDVVLYVGRLSPKKGTHILLNAMKKVMQQHKNATLMIIGSKWYGKNEADEYTQMLTSLAKELPSPVVFTGFLQPSEIYKYYNAGDVFVCSSQWNEPLARVHYEAMAAGLPIITTNRGGNGEIIEHGVNGLVIDDYKNPDAFMECINYILSNPAAARMMGTNARKLAEEKFTWERVASEVLHPFNRRNNIDTHGSQAVKSTKKPPATAGNNAIEQSEDFFGGSF